MGSPNSRYIAVAEPMISARSVAAMAICAAMRQDDSVLVVARLINPAAGCCSEAKSASWPAAACLLESNMLQTIMMDIGWTRREHGKVHGSGACLGQNPQPQVDPAWVCVPAALCQVPLGHHAQLQRQRLQQWTT